MNKRDYSSDVGDGSVVFAVKYERSELKIMKKKSGLKEVTILFDFHFKAGRRRGVGLGRWEWVCWVIRKKEKEKK